MALNALDQEIEDLASRLSNRQQAQASKGDTHSWEQAEDYVRSRERIVRLADEEGIRLTPQQINKRIRQVEGYKGPGTTFLTHSWRCNEVFTDVFSSTTKKAPFDMYKQIANSRLTDEQKRELRRWVEEEPVTQGDLRQRIKALQGDDVQRRGFRLMTTNLWKFASSDGADDQGFDGGISNDVVANLLHFFTDPGDVVVDPMAGSGRTGYVVSKLPYFSPDWEDEKDWERGGPRQVLMSDIDPAGPEIIRADCQESIPFSDADFVLLDPPYWKIAEGKYNHGGDKLEQWLEWLEGVARNVHQTLKPSGVAALVLDDFLRSRQTVPLAHLGAETLKRAGFIHRMSIYNNYNNASASMGALQQWRAMVARLPVNGVKIINIFERP